MNIYVSYHKFTFTMTKRHSMPILGHRQSNMQLMLDYTFDVNATIEGIKAGKYDNIRLFYGPMNFDYGTNRTDIWYMHP